MSNTKRTILALIIIFIVLMGGIRACQFYALKSALKTNKQLAKLDSNTYLESAPKEYFDLFENKSSIICDSSITSRHRALITKFHNEQYCIQVCKLDSLHRISLNNINQSFNSSESSLHSYYINVPLNSKLEIRYKLGGGEEISSLYFSLYGDHTQVIEKNDSMAYYYSNLENFSLSYQKDGKIDIYGNRNESSPNLKVPVEILFFNRNNSLYFILLTNRNPSESLKVDALYNLITKR